MMQQGTMIATIQLLKSIRLSKAVQIFRRNKCLVRSDKLQAISQVGHVNLPIIFTINRPVLAFSIVSMPNWPSIAVVLGFFHLLIFVLPKSRTRSVFHPNLPVYFGGVFSSLHFQIDFLNNLDCYASLHDAALYNEFLQSKF